MVYLDYSATTPVDKRVLDTFNKVCLEYPGNTNSLHSLGVKSHELSDYATEEIAKMLHVKKSEIIYTSGASESNNTVIKGVCERYKNRGKHIITTFLEHSSIIAPLNYLTSQGFEVDFVKIDDNGLVDLEDLKRLMRDDTILVSVCAVDSELGLKQPIKEISEIVRKYPKCYFHVDCTQALGKINIDLSGVDFASFSGHKIFGLKGIGLLYKKENIVIEPLIHGGKSTTICSSICANATRAARRAYRRKSSNAPPRKTPATCPLTDSTSPTRGARALSATWRTTCSPMKRRS